MESDGHVRLLQFGRQLTEPGQILPFALVVVNRVHVNLIVTSDKNTFGSGNALSQN